MSPRWTVAGNDAFHLYGECGDDHHVYVQSSESGKGFQLLDCKTEFTLRIAKSALNRIAVDIEKGCLEPLKGDSPQEAVTLRVVSTSRDHLTLAFVSKGKSVSLNQEEFLPGVIRLPGVTLREILGHWTKCRNATP